MVIRHLCYVRIPSSYCVVPPQIPPKEIEKIEEEKLKSRFNPRPAGHSAFLQKRLAKGVSSNITYYFYLIHLCTLKCSVASFYHL